jgi:hypothetical protein
LILLTIKDVESPTPRFKARFVGKGYTQIHGIDYDETFAPVIKSTSARIIFSQATSDGHLLSAFNIETAFLNSEMDRELYLKLPETYSSDDYPRDQYVLQAMKGLYGFKQSAHLWSNDIKEKMISLGFTQSDADEGVFLSADKRITVAIYVDDGLIKAEHQYEIDWVIAKLSKHCLGFPKKFLGLNIHRPEPCGPITISQSTYARKLLAKFDMENCYPVKAPCDGNASALHARTEHKSPTPNPELYRSITSSIMHLAVWTHPDIAYIVNKLCQYNHDPSEIHTKSAKYLLCYIANTLDYGITYSQCEGNTLYGMFMDYDDQTGLSIPTTPLYGYSDASGASDPDDRCSTSGYVFFYNNGPVIWASRKQKYTVTLSTMESEYVALMEAAKEAAFLRKLLKSINLTQTSPTLILIDSESALKNVKNNVNYSCAKHIATRHHYIRMAYNSGEVDIRHVPSVSQTADVLTKPLGIIKHTEAVKLLMLHDIRYV